MGTSSFAADFQGTDSSSHRLLARSRLTLRSTAGRVTGSIFIETNDPEFPKLRVPVSGLVIAKL